MQQPIAMSLSFSLLIIIFSSLMQHANAALSQTYCSSQNTGSSSAAKYWTWQSNGWCHDECDGSYAFAIVQGNNCWCSDYAPADQQDLSNCQSDCPGYPDEKCGNPDKGLFGYVALDKSPSGTLGSSQASSTATPSSSAAPLSSDPPSSKAAVTTKAAVASSSPPSDELSTIVDSQTVYETVTASPLAAAPSSAQSSAQPTSSAAESAAQTTPQTTLQAAPRTTLQTSSTRQTSSSFIATPITSIQTLTVSGVVVTQTVTSMSTPPPTITRKGASAGTIAGAVVGGVAGLALVSALFFFLLRRRRQDPPTSEESGNAAPRPRRNVSTLSRTGLLRPEKDHLPPVVTTMNRHSRNMDHESISPVPSEKRNSRPLFYDQRLNPTALMDLDNGSQVSIGTIQDNRDYHRTLNIRNPDPTLDPQ